MSRCCQLLWVKTGYSSSQRKDSSNAVYCGWGLDKEEVVVWPMIQWAGNVPVNHIASDVWIGWRLPGSRSISSWGRIRGLSLKEERHVTNAGRTSDCRRFDTKDTVWQSGDRVGGFPLRLRVPPLQTYNFQWHLGHPCGKISTHSVESCWIHGAGLWTRPEILNALLFRRYNDSSIEKWVGPESQQAWPSGRTSELAGAVQRQDHLDQMLPCSVSMGTS